ncbi:MAG: LacI family DNA-binding transcriptional regulator [Spirochaetales bacterium]|nr:LacI family DNA-binding transcriptional regulator [Spirochaetales bacterium]
MGRASIASVARKAGVSLSTVSRVLNEPGKVNPDTRRQVFDAMRELEYTPVARRRAKRQQSGMVALAVPNLHLDSVIEFFRELQRVLLPFDKHLIVLDLEGERNFFEYQRFRELPLDQYDAVVAFSLLLDRQAADLLERHTVPSVVVQSRNPYLFSINNNNYSGGFDAASYLLGRGYRRPAFVGWNFENETLRDRRAGYRAALEQAGIDTATLPEETGPLDFHGGMEAMERLLELPEAPDCVFFSCDVMALGGLEACRRRCLPVPGALGIMGFDDIAQAEWWGLTTMNQHLKEKAEAVAGYLSDRWAGKQPHERPMEITISSRVVARSTTR